MNGILYDVLCFSEWWNGTIETVSKITRRPLTQLFVPTGRFDPVCFVYILPVVFQNQLQWSLCSFRVLLIYNAIFLVSYYTWNIQIYKAYQVWPCFVPIFFSLQVQCYCQLYYKDKKIVCSNFIYFNKFLDYKCQRVSVCI